jgi:hypothetical protein
VLERLYEGRGPHCGSRQRGDRAEKARIDLIERLACERIRRERSHELVAHTQRTPQAGMHVSLRRRSLQEAVEWIRERRIVRKAHRLARVADDLKARVLAQVEPALRRVMA